MLILTAANTAQVTRDAPRGEFDFGPLKNKMFMRQRQSLLPIYKGLGMTRYCPVAATYLLTQTPPLDGELQPR